MVVIRKNKNLKTYKQAKQTELLFTMYDKQGESGVGSSPDSTAIFTQSMQERYNLILIFCLSLRP